MSDQPTPEVEVRFTVYEEVRENHLRVSIFDDEFHWDVAMRIYGDFASLEDKMRFAQAVCDVLNEAGERIPKK